MSDPRFPPIDPGPFLPPWPGVDSPRLSRPIPVSPPYSGGGGVSIPPGTPETFSTQKTAVLNGSRIFAVMTASQKVLDAPSTYRNFLLIRNSSTAATVVYIDFGGDASLNSAIRLAQNEIILFDAVVPQDDLYVIGDAAGQISVLVGVISLPV